MKIKLTEGKLHFLVWKHIATRVIFHFAQQQDVVEEKSAIIQEIFCSIDFPRGKERNSVLFIFKRKQSVCFFCHSKISKLSQLGALLKLGKNFPPLA